MPIQSRPPIGDDDGVRRRWPRPAAPARHRRRARSSRPSMSGQCGLAPVATMTASGASRSTSARSTAVPRTMRTPASSHLAREIGRRCRRTRRGRGRSCASSAWPPSCVARLVERHLVAALGGDGGSFHAGRTAAGDQHTLLARDRRPCAMRQLAARSPDAGCRRSSSPGGNGGCRPGCRRCRRGCRRRGPACGLVRHLRVGDHRPRHAAHVGLAGGDDLLGDLRLVDAAGDQAPASSRPAFTAAAKGAT